MALAPELDYSHALIAPGQGNQKIGMGLELAGGENPKSKAAARIWEEADDVLGSHFKFTFSLFVWYGLRGSEQLSPEQAQVELTKTEYAQPAIIVDSLARKAALDELGLLEDPKPGYNAGNSLGFISAARNAGSLTVAATVALGEGRGEAFRYAIANSPRTTMMALSLANIDLGLVEKLKCDYDLEVCLKNPGQRVLGGRVENQGRDIKGALGWLRGELGEDRFKEEVTSLEGMVDAAFHSKYMMEAVVKYKDIVNSIPVSAPTEGRLVGGSTVRELSTEEDVRNELVLQLTETEDWEGVVNLFREKGVTRMTELNSDPRLSAMNRRAFSGLIRKIYIPGSTENQDLVAYRWFAPELMSVAGGSESVSREDVATWYLQVVSRRTGMDEEELNGDTNFEHDANMDSEDIKWLRAQVRAKWGRNVSDEEAKTLVTIGFAIDATYKLVNS